MNFKDYSELKGTHAFLSASSHHWINYSDEKLVERFNSFQAAARGTRLHAFAEEAISLRIKLPRSKKTLNMYVNDVIGYRMRTEQILFYSLNAYGTADAISFNKNLLRIFDYKSGVTPASPRQLEVYTALFCLEYGKSPNDINIELRVYQNDDVLVWEPEKEDILYIMQKIVDFDKLIEDIKSGNDIYE